MDGPVLPDFLTHYYEAARGPFRSLTALAPAQAAGIVAELASAGVFASQRAADYLDIRRELEQRIRTLFIARGGQPERSTPHYLILGACDWVRTWYADGREARIPLSACDPRQVSFTYGDSFPAMRFGDGRAYRGRVYTLDDLPGLVRTYGLPQDSNPDGARGPDRYIEAQLWADEPLASFGYL